MKCPKRDCNGEINEIAELEKRCDRFAKDLVRLQDLRELGVNVKWDYKATLHAFLDTKKEIKKLKGEMSEEIDSHYVCGECGCTVPRERSQQ